MTDNDWPEGHAEFVAYCHAHPEALLGKTPFGWFQAGLQAGREGLMLVEVDAAQIDALKRVGAIFTPPMDSEQS